jgi:thiol-disulfide isomerase/thioredoxin
MKWIFTPLLLLTTGILFAQPPSQALKLEDKIDSLMCPIGYAAKGHPYLPFLLANDQKTVGNQNVSGKVVFINFWFEGCHPCMAEMDALNKLFEKMKDNKDFVFITVTWDNTETIKRVTNKFSLSFDIFATSPAECERLNFGCGYPTSVILDKKGIVQYRHSGGSTDKKKADQFVLTTLLTEIESLL